VILVYCSLLYIPFLTEPSTVLIRVRPKVERFFTSQFRSFGGV